MRILVPIKRVLDYAARVRVKPDNSGIDLVNAKMSMNPFCEIAVEEALRLRESKVAREVVAVSVGGAACKQVLQTAYGMGVDAAMHVETEEELCPLDIAHILAEIARTKLSPGLLLFGKQAIDDDYNQTVQTLHVREPPKRQGGIMLGTVAELVDKLRNEAKVL